MWLATQMSTRKWLWTFKTSFRSNAIFSIILVGSRTPSLYISDTVYILVKLAISLQYVFYHTIRMTVPAGPGLV